MHQSSVIWITGFSASGKTTVGRHLDARLRENDVRSVFLDGDDLRSILAHRWGYSREDRVDLARVYFRLCNHLATQGVTVVISAVAMYEDVRQWVKENVAGAVEVYLDVPEDERRERDRATKQIYDQIGAQTKLYDEPQNPDLAIPNYGGVTAEEAAERILEFVESAPVIRGRPRPLRALGQLLHRGQGARGAFELRSTGRRRSSEIRRASSRSAAETAATRRSSPVPGAEVTAVDVSEKAIVVLPRALRPLRTCRSSTGDIGAVPDDDASFDAVYSRFCLHAMTRVEEDEFVERAARLCAMAAGCSSSAARSRTRSPARAR